MTGGPPDTLPIIDSRSLNIIIQKISTLFVYIITYPLMAH